MICPLCPQFIPFYRLSKHLNAAHGSKLRCTYKCKIVGCNRRYSTFKSFSEHYAQCCKIIGSINHTDTGSDLSVETLHESVPNCDESVTSSPQHESVPISIDCDKNNQELLRDWADVFVAKLYSKPNLPRNHIQTMVEEVSGFVSQCNSLLKDQVKEILSKCDLCKDKLSHVEVLFEPFSKPFKHISTEYHRLKYFAKSGNLIQPIPVEVGKRRVTCTSDKGTTLKDKPCCVQSIPVGKVLKAFLELPDAFSSITSYLEYLKLSDGVGNFMQCTLWKSIRSKFSSEDIVLPLFLYVDDFQCNNPLGSHAKSLGACYLSLPFLPPECQSTVDNIFLALLYETSFRAEFSDEKVFAPLISQLTSLERDGITISTPNGEKKLFLVTSLLLGDNKGVNSLLGFTECFTANYFCRFCKSHRNVTHTQSVEDVSTLRDKTSYEEDLALNNVSLTGLNFNSALNKLPSFHVTSNYSVDSFHDLLEGVCHYTMLHVLKHCIPKYFDLDCLNNRISFFSYGFCDSNRIPEIGSGYASRDKLKMSGSEMLLFVKLFGLIIGDLIPEDDSYYSLYLKLRQILEICLSKSISRQHSVILRVLVEEFNTMYVSITKDTLKPKFHNLLHYSMVLESSGSLELLACRRFESKHRSLTVPAHTTYSRLNTTATLASRYQLSQCFRFVSKQSIIPSVQFGPAFIMTVSDFEKCYLLRKALPASFVSDSFLSVTWVEIKGTVYKPGVALTSKVTDHGPVYAQLEEIFVQDETILFVITYLLNTGFSERIRAYSVDSSEIWSCLNPNDLQDPLPLNVYSDSKGNKFIIPRSILY